MDSKKHGAGGREGRQEGGKKKTKTGIAAKNLQ